MNPPPSGEAPTEDRCITPDGVGIATYDFGGHGSDLLFVHATGLCAGVFLPLARHLGEDFHCWGLDLRAHGRSDRPEDGIFAWSRFAIDVLAAVDHLGLERPFAFGHSCGATSVILAEEAVAGRFSAAYCFEPVMVPAPSTSDSSLGDQLAARARGRRDVFPSPDAAYASFSSRPPFGSFDPEALHEYIEGGFESVPPAEGGDGSMIRLRCRREDEAEMYANGIAHDAYQRLDEVGCPVLLACGALTDAFGEPALRADADRLRNASIEVIAGVGHFGPLERPAAVAASVRSAGISLLTPPSAVDPPDRPR